MATAAIIAEYNPFHKGHLYHIERTRAAGADQILVIMSGNFVQRSESAVMRKQARAETALRNGADLVIELPLPWATASAEKFASGGVYIADALGTTETLSFGSECGDTEALRRAAELVLGLDGSRELKESLSSGVSFPRARAEALGNGGQREMLSSPNDILGIEYIKALIRSGSAIRPLAIKRIGPGHDSGAETEGCVSAREIRKRIGAGDGTFKGYMPPAALEILKREIAQSRAPSDFRALENSILADLRKRDKEYFLKLDDVSEGLENRAARAVNDAGSLDGLYSAIKTKRYTFSRVRRIVLSAYLEIFSRYSALPPPYIRVLGFNERGKDMLREASGRASLPIVTRPCEIAELGGRAAEIFALEAKATAIFNLTLPEKRPANTEYTDKIIITVKK